MKHWKALLVLAMIASVFCSAPVFAEERVSTRPMTPNVNPEDPNYVEHKTSADPTCDEKKAMDDINLCRALHPFDTKNKDRYQNKDHSYYYCTLIQNRDKQTYCYAVVRQQSNLCGLIIDGEIEKECKSKFQ